ncbi:MAG: tetratricopeptide repeat protein [Anaerolineaceae bacterium]|nr:tetratricopeptide repeat protein [Anaerolineaceae bacterium]
MQLDRIVTLLVISITLLVIGGWVLAPYWTEKRKQSRTPNAAIQPTEQPQSEVPNSFSSSLPFVSPFPLKAIGTEFQKGVYYANHHDYGSAIAEFTHFIDANQDHPNPSLEMAYVYRAFAFQKNKQFEKALSDYDMAISISPNSVQSYIHRAEFKSRCLDDNQSALVDINAAIQLDGDLLNAYLIRGLVRAKLKHEDAFEDFEQALRLAKHRSPAKIYVQRGQAYYAVNNYSAALKDFREAIRLGTDQADYCLCMMAQIFREKRDYKQAIAIHNERLKHRPNEPAIYLTRGYVRQRAGDIEGAVADYEKMMELSPKLPVSFNNRACVYILQGRYDQALEDCERAFNRDAKFIYAFATRGTVYFLQAKYIEALNDFDQAITIDAKHKFAILGQAITLYQLGKREEAKARWDALKALDAKYTSKENLQYEVMLPDTIMTVVAQFESEIGTSDE